MATKGNSYDETDRLRQRMHEYYGTGSLSNTDKNLEQSDKVRKLLGVDSDGRDISEQPTAYTDAELGSTGITEGRVHQFDAAKFLNPPSDSNRELSPNDLPVHWKKIQKRLDTIEGKVLSSIEEKLANFRNTYTKSVQDDERFGMIVGDLQNRLKLSTTSTGMFGRGDRVLGDDGKKVAIYLRELQKAIDGDAWGDRHQKSIAQMNQQLHEIENMERRIQQLDLKNTEQKELITRLEREKEELLAQQGKTFAEINRQRRESEAATSGATKSAAKAVTRKKTRNRRESFGNTVRRAFRRTRKQNPRNRVTISSGESSGSEIDINLFDIDSDSDTSGGYKKRRKTRKRQKKRKKRRKTKKRKRCTKKRLRKKMICVKGAKKKLKKLRAYTKKIKLNLTRCSKKRMKKWSLKKR